MKIPTFKRLNKQDYENQYSKLIETLSFSLNNGIDVLYEALNKKLTFSDNFLGTVKDVDVIVDALGNPIVPTAVKIDFATPVQGVRVMKATNLTNTAIYPTSSPWISWEQTATGITILNVTGLQANNSYRLRILVEG